MRRTSRARYTAIGYVVSKFVLPMARKQAKKAARNKVRGMGGALGRHPARVSLAVGSAIGALGWLLSHRDADTDSGE
jgi:hypothetical protein